MSDFQQGKPLSTLSRSYTRADIDEMMKADRSMLLVIVKGEVYNVTKFAPEHPGGWGVIREHKGEDITELFASLHGRFAWQQLPAFRIGPFVETPKPAEPAGCSANASGKDMTTAQLEQFLRKNPRKLYTVLFGRIYDLTEFAGSHPGGSFVLQRNSGNECGDSFMRIHSSRAKGKVGAYYVGLLTDSPFAEKPSPLDTFTGGAPASKSRSAAAAADGPQPLRRRGDNNGASGAATSARGGGNASGLSKADVFSARLLEVRPSALPGGAGTNPNIRYLTLSSPEPLRLLPGGHVRLYTRNPLIDGDTDENGERTWADYTPYEVRDTSFSLCLKFYPGGRRSPALFSKQYGDEIFYSGPKPPSWQAARDPVLAALSRDAPAGTAPLVGHVMLFAGGTGAAPLFSIAKFLLKSSASSPAFLASGAPPPALQYRVTLVCSVRAGDEVILEAELQRLQQAFPDTLSVAFVVTRETEPERVAALRTRLAWAAGGVHTGAHLSAATARDIASRLHGTSKDEAAAPTADSVVTAVHAAVMCGPPAHNRGIRGTLVEARVCASSRIHDL